MAEVFEISPRKPEVFEITGTPELKPEVFELPDETTVVHERGAVEKFGRGANMGIAQTLGAPVDLVNSALSLIGRGSQEPVLGSRHIQRGLASLGIAPRVGEDDPDTLAGSMGHMTGSAATMLLPLGLPMRAVASGEKATTAGGRVVQDIARTAMESPKAFMARETVAAASAGAAGFAAREKFPDSPAAQVISELVGGSAPGAVVGALKVTPTVIGARALKRFTSQFTQRAGEPRAAKRLAEVTHDVERATGELSRPNVLPEAGLTPAQQSGDRGILALERSIIESSGELAGKSDEQIANATRVIRESLENLGEGVSPEKTADTIRESRSYLQSLLDTRLRIASRKADEKIAALGPNASREEANIVARQEVEDALSAARETERGLWGAIPEDTAVSTNNARQAYNDIVGGLPRAQQEDVPEIARRFLDPDSNARVGDEDTIAELQGLRSKLLEEARIARSNGQRNKARIADDLADGILQDMGAARGAIEGDAGEALRMALDFSAELNKRFTQGSVGRLLGTTRRGGAAVQPELTLETTVAKGGPRASVETRALQEAVEFSRDSAALRGSVEDFLLDEFNRTAVKDGALSKASAERFLSKHQDTLQRFPSVRKKITDAVNANDAAVAASDLKNAVAKKLNDPRISRTSIFIKEPVDEALKRVSKSANPEQTMKLLVNSAKKDATGDAMKGLKTALGDFLLESASTRKATEAGDFVVSGRALKALLEKGNASKMIKAVLSPAEQKRLETIANTAEKLERAVAAKTADGGIVNDPPSILLATIARIGAAQVGRQVAQKTGGGTVQTPGILSNLAKKAVERGVNDPARRLLIDAMNDEKLLKALLESPTKAMESEAVKQQLNAWLASVAMDAARGQEIPEGFEFSRKENGKVIIKDKDGKQHIQQ